MSSILAVVDSLTSPKLTDRSGSSDDEEKESRIESSEYPKMVSSCPNPICVRKCRCRSASAAHGRRKDGVLYRSCLTWYVKSGLKETLAGGGAPTSLRLRALLASDAHLSVIAVLREMRTRGNDD